MGGWEGEAGILGGHHKDHLSDNEALQHLRPMASGVVGSWREHLGLLASGAADSAWRRVGSQLGAIVNAQGFPSSRGF